MTVEIMPDNSYNLESLDFSSQSPFFAGPAHRGYDSEPQAAIVGIAFGGILLGVVLVVALLFFKKIGPFAKKPEEVSKPPEEPPIEMVEYQFTGKPELDSSPAPVSQKYVSEIGGMPVEYYALEKEGTASSPNSPRSPNADRRSLMSGTVSPVSDGGGDSRARRESNLSNGPSP